MSSVNLRHNEERAARPPALIIHIVFIMVAIQTMMMMMMAINIILMIIKTTTTETELPIIDFSPITVPPSPAPGTRIVARRTFLL